MIWKMNIAELYYNGKEILLSHCVTMMNIISGTTSVTRLFIRTPSSASPLRLLHSQVCPPTLPLMTSIAKKRLRTWNFIENIVDISELLYE